MIDAHFLIKSTVSIDWDILFDLEMFYVHVSIFYILNYYLFQYALNESNSQQNLFEDIRVVIDTSKKLSCTSKKLLFFYKGRDV